MITDDFRFLLIYYNPSLWLRLEAYTELSESNPGRSLGVKDKKKGAVWKTVPY